MSSEPSTPAAAESGRRARLSVGSRVVLQQVDALGGPVRAAGVIVDDFSDTLVEHRHYGREWAISKRWAVALDSGSLVFRDDNELERE